ncbi:hypothetical protein [Flavobacterium sp. ov086]|uniref:hypothetical protein n=1 Tax=Flavobacterium sp. ov086 TaxID=1761785 RepID=UPI0011329BCD|nr:hypothetical protein [Flavobacterium sp. ov086]
MLTFNDLILFSEQDRKVKTVFLLRPSFVNLFPEQSKLSNASKSSIPAKLEMFFSEIFSDFILVIAAVNTFPSGFPESYFSSIKAFSKLTSGIKVYPVMACENKLFDAK